MESLTENLGQVEGKMSLLLRCKVMHIANVIDRGVSAGLLHGSS